MYNLKISKKSQKFLKAIQPKHARQIKSKILDLQHHEISHDSKQLSGYSLMRADSGEYRIIYKIEEKILSVILGGATQENIP